MATTTTTTTTVNATVTTTTTGAALRPAPWETPCYRARHARFKKSRIARDLRKFVRLARQVSDLGHALVARLPRAEVIDAFSLDDGESAGNLADSIRGGLWAFDIAFGLVESELPFDTTGLARRTPSKRKSAEAPAPRSAPPLIPVIDCRTPAEREQDERAGKDWAAVATEVVLGVAEPLVPAGRPVNRVKGIA